MTEDSRAIAATVVGAVVGAIAGYLFFTERGRTARRQIDPALEDFARELDSFGVSLRKAANTANEGWKLLNDTLGDRPSPSRTGAPRQTSPF